MKKWWGRMSDGVHSSVQFINKVIWLYKNKWACLIYHMIIIIIIIIIIRIILKTNRRNRELYASTTHQVKY